MTTIEELGIITSILLLSVVWVVWSFSENYGREGSQIFSCVSTAVFTIWLIVVSVANNETELFVPTKVEIVVGNRIVIIDDGDKFYRLIGKDYVDKISDTTTFYRIKTTNIWGYEDFEELVCLVGDPIAVDGYIELKSLRKNN